MWKKKVPIYSSCSLKVPYYGKLDSFIFIIVWIIQQVRVLTQRKYQSAQSCVNNNTARIQKRYLETSSQDLPNFLMSQIISNHPQLWTTQLQNNPSEPTILSRVSWRQGQQTPPNLALDPDAATLRTVQNDPAKSGWSMEELEFCLAHFSFTKV